MLLKRVVARISALGTALFAVLAPGLALAHEVYVLPAHEINTAMHTSAFDMLGIALQDADDFLFWGIISCAVVFVVFSISIIRPLERMLDPLLMRLKPYAAAVARVTVGLGLLASAYYGASYGPELPFASTFGDAAMLVRGLVALLGLMFVLNISTRLAALAALVLFACGIVAHGSYMLTYTNYVGEFIVLLVGFHEGIQHARVRGWWKKIGAQIAPYGWAILRVCFGMSLLYASFYAKIVHNNLALDVASLPLAGHAYPLAHYFGMEPHFLVLGVAIIELVLGSFFVLGIEIRFTSLFLEFWLALSLWYFGEVVWPHLILIGIPIALFLHGYDRWSLEGFYFAKGKREPVL